MKWPNAAEIRRMNHDQIRYWMGHDGSQDYKPCCCPTDQQGSHLSMCYLSVNSGGWRFDPLELDGLVNIYIEGLKALNNGENDVAREALVNLYHHAAVAREALKLAEKIESLHGG